MTNELEIERIFSYGVALEQSGNQKNSVFGWENVIYIMNSDKTILLRFEASTNEFKEPIRFFLSDYDSPNFTSDGNSITFLQKGEEFIRSKRCRIPNQTFQEVEELFYKFYDTNKMKWRTPFSKSMLELLDTNLSHIEFTIREDKKIKILQRDIYSGAVIELERKDLESEGFGLLGVEENLPEKMEPIGIRTGDFLALFNFSNKIDMWFPPFGKYFIVEGLHNQMSAIISGCLYDSIGTIMNLQEEKVNIPVLKKRLK